jgi:hypothetical protein
MVILSITKLDVLFTTHHAWIPYKLFSSLRGILSFLPLKLPLAWHVFGHKLPFNGNFERGCRTRRLSTPCIAIGSARASTEIRRRTPCSVTFVGSGSRGRRLCTPCTWTCYGRGHIWMLRRKACTVTLFCRGSIWKLRHSLCTGSEHENGGRVGRLDTAYILTFGWRAGTSQMEYTDWKSSPCQWL